MNAKLSKILLLIILFSFFGCKTIQNNTKIVSKNDSIKVEYKDKYIRDSIYVKDSIFIEKMLIFYYQSNLSYLNVSNPLAI